jgi:hypothetical protein
MGSWASQRMKHKGPRFLGIWDMENVMFLGFANHTTAFFQVVYQILNSMA